MNEENKEPTPEELAIYYATLINKFKQDPNWELELEFGRMLMRHIDSYTPEERKRYDELMILLKQNK